MFNHPPYRPDLAPSDFHLFLHLKEFLSGQRFQDDREAEMSVTGYKSWSPGVTNVLIPEVNMLKSSSTFAVFVAISLSIELCFVSVNGPRETYFVDALQ